MKTKGRNLPATEGQAPPQTSHLHIGGAHDFCCMCAEVLHDITEHHNAFIGDEASLLQEHLALQASERLSGLQPPAPVPSGTAA